MSNKKFTNIRNDFPIFKKKINGYPLIYLDSAATSQKPQVMIDALSNFYANEYGTVNRAVYSLSQQATHRYNLAREAVQKFVGAEFVEEIIFTRGTTESINFVKEMIKDKIQEDDEILLTEAEHHANLIPWQMLAKEKKARLVFVPVQKSGEISLEAFEKCFTKKTKIASFTHISNVLGIVNPIEEMAALAKKKNALVLIDGAQAAPHIPLDLKTVAADFYVFSGHKVFGPTGIGVLYGKKKWLEQLPPPQGGGDMVLEASYQEATYQQPPLKFEAGTPLIAEAIGLHASIDYLQQFDREALHAYVKELTAYAIDNLAKEANIRFLGTSKDKSHLITFVVENVHPYDLASYLDLKGIAIRTGHLCALPLHRLFGHDHSMRVSFSIYNTKSDIDYFIENLNVYIRKLSLI